MYNFSLPNLDATLLVDLLCSGAYWQLLSHTVLCGDLYTVYACVDISRTVFLDRSTRKSEELQLSVNRGYHVATCSSSNSNNHYNYLTFSHTHKVGNNGINANIIILYICSSLHYLYPKMIVNMKLDSSW